MPRINRARTIEAERNLARRIRMEREDRNWSPAQLAQHMTEAGCSISTSAIYKIEDSEKPRKITVDELVALADVFGVDDVRDLLKPVEEVYQDRANAILKKLDEADRDLFAAIIRRMEGLTELFELRAEEGARVSQGRDSQNERDAYEYVMNMLFARTPKKLASEQPEPLFFVYREDGSQREVSDEPLREALRALLTASAKTAAEVVFDEIERRRSNGKR